MAVESSGHFTPDSRQLSGLVTAGSENGRMGGEIEALSGVSHVCRGDWFEHQQNSRCEVYDASASRLRNVPEGGRTGGNQTSAGRVCRWYAADNLGAQVTARPGDAYALAALLIGLI